MRLIKNIINIIRVINGTIFHICKYNRLNIAIVCLAWAAIATPSYLYFGFKVTTQRAIWPSNYISILELSLIVCGSILVYFCVSWFIDQCRLYANKDKLR